MNEIGDMWRVILLIVLLVVSMGLLFTVFQFFLDIYRFMKEPKTVVNNTWEIPQFGKGTISIGDNKCEFDIKREEKDGEK